MFRYPLNDLVKVLSQGVCVCVCLVVFAAGLGGFGLNGFLSLGVDSFRGFNLRLRF